MNNITPNSQIEIFGLNKYFDELLELDKKKCLPNKILLTGLKGLGKSTLAYHFINYALSKDEKLKYDIKQYRINPESHTFKTIQNRSNPNFNLIDINPEKKSIDINQIRNLISNLNKSAFNLKPRFVLIDNIEYLNLNSINSLLKILEEPSQNIFFILINNGKKVLPTLLSRCINFKISLNNNQCLEISNKLLNNELKYSINHDLINYYITPGNLLNLYNFAKMNNYDLSNQSLKQFLKMIIDNNFYKKDNLIKYLIFDLIEFYFTKINLSLSSNVYNQYTYFIKRISDTKRFNLDEEYLFTEFKDEILNG